MTGLQHNILSWRCKSVKEYQFWMFVDFASPQLLLYVRIQKRVLGFFFLYSLLATGMLMYWRRFTPVSRPWGCEWEAWIWRKKWYFAIVRLSNPDSYRSLSSCLYILKFFFKKIATFCAQPVFVLMFHTKDVWPSYTNLSKM